MPHAHNPVLNQFTAVDAIVIASSLGGRGVLERILGPLPSDFPVPIIVAQHRGMNAIGYLPTLLKRATRLVVKEAEHGERLRGSHVYLAPSNRHTAISAERRCVLLDGPKVNFARPAADVLFMSAAAAYSSRVLGIVLTGRLQDGTAGALSIRRSGGIVLVQEPATCEAASMPEAVIRAGAAHCALPPVVLSAAIIGLVRVPGTVALFGFHDKLAA
jgi:two-component system, chemotaxis family, protein-glutamate methylesterase/glutaminase